MVFSAVTPATGREPWVSDGTKAGTHIVQRIIPFSSIFTDETQGQTMRMVQATIYGL